MLSFLAVRIRSIEGCDKVHNLWNESNAYGMLSLNHNKLYCFEFGGSITLFEKSKDIKVEVYEDEKQIIDATNPIGLAIPIEESNLYNYVVKITSFASGIQTVKIANSIDKFPSFKFVGSKIFISTLSNTEYTFNEADDNEAGLAFIRFNDGETKVDIKCNFESNDSYVQYKDDSNYSKVIKLSENQETLVQSKSAYSIVEFYDAVDKNGVATIKYTSNNSDWTNRINATLLHFNSAKALFAKDFDGVVPNPESEASSDDSESEESEEITTEASEPNESNSKKIMIIGGIIIAAIIFVSLTITIIVACCTCKSRHIDSDLKRELLL